MAVYISNLVVGLEKGLDNHELLLEAAAPFQGQVGIEFFLHDYDPGYLGKTPAIPTWLGELPAAAHGPFIGVEAASYPGTPEQERLLEAYRYGFETAAKLRCPHLVFHTHQRVIPKEEKPALMEACRQNIRHLLDMGRAQGVQLLIENLGIQKTGVSLFDQKEFVALLKEFPKAGCLIDTGHLNVAGWNVEETLAALGERIVGFHLHNNDGVHDSHRRIHDGTFDHDLFFALYRKYTPFADLTLEYGDAYGITAPMLQEDVRYVLNSAKLFDKTERRDNP